MAVLLIFWRDGETRCEWDPELGRIRLATGVRVHREDAARTSLEALERARAFYAHYELLDDAGREALKEEQVHS